MRNRLPLFLAALMLVPALLVAGCGDDKSSTTNTPESTMQVTATTGSTSDSASDRAQATLASCQAMAEKLPDEADAKKAKQACQDSYDNIADASKKIDESTKEAVKKCKEAAEQVPDETARENALAACERFQ